MRTARSLRYDVGDQVYYKRSDSKWWRGPGTVIGKENKHIFVKHVGTYLRVNPCHVRAVRDKGKPLNTNKDLCEQGKSLVTEKEVDSTKEIMTTTDNDDEEMTYEEENLGDEKNLEDEKNLGDAQESDMEPAVEEFSEDEQDIVVNRQTSVDIEGSYLGTVNCERNMTVLEGKVPAKGSKIEYQLPDSDHWLEAQILRTTGKASGKNRWWYNVYDLKDGSLKIINLAEIREWKYKEEEILLSSTIDKTEVLIEVKRQELEI